MASTTAELARQHQLLHFTDMQAEIPVIVRGDGCRVYDESGRGYIDGLSGLYCTNLGHSFGDELGAIAHAQMKELAFVSNWTLAHPRSAELGAKIASLAPEGLNRVFFTSGGSESVEAAWKLARQYHAANGEPQRRKAIARKYAYHGVTLGALSFTGIPSCRAPFEPLAVPVHHVSNTNAYRHPQGDDPEALTTALLAELEEAIEFETADQVAMVIAEPVQNAGGCIPPPPGYWRGLREICDRHGILLCSDEVICAWGRLGEWFGAQRFDYVPDLLTFAKGLTSAHAAMGGVLIHDRVAQPFMEGEMYMHGMTFGGHPVGSAIALGAIDIMEREGVLDNVRATAPHAQARLERLLDIPIVGDVRGVGYFWALELVKNPGTKETFEGAEADWLLGDILSDRMRSNGLICRLDDRSDPAVQLAPPLVADADLWDEIIDIVEDGLRYASDRIVEAPAHAV